MALRHGLTSGVRCLGCQRHVLRSFISSLASSTSASKAPSSISRAFSTTSRRRNDVDNTWKDDVSSHAKIAAVSAQTASAGDEAKPTESQKPWYLQVKEHQGFEQDVQNPFAERQRIPELPADPPPMLEALLRHISIDIGLDYLTLLDLRTMDPPPALGNNLLMIFGTARSERHLNVAADRLCRWLRTTYKLRPVADGLLGRNELKLKLRRKNRRSKMLGAAGAIDPGNYDDGIHTGWICVNVGSVEGPSNSPSKVDRIPDDGFVGFGEEDNRPKIVVQIMTEEKRGEVELESLWQTAYDRSLRRTKAQQKAAEGTATEELDSQDVEVDPEQARGVFGAGKRHSPERPFLQASPSVHQTRPMHTRARVLNLANELDEYELEPHLLQPAKQDQLKLDRTTTKFPAPPSTSRDEAHPLRLDTSSRSLQTSLDYLYKLDKQVALRELGAGEHDRSSTSFLTNVYSSLPPFLEEQHWRLLTNLQTYALEIGHLGYTRSGLLQLMRRMHVSLPIIPQDILMSIFVSMLQAPLVVHTEVKDNTKRPTTPQDALKHSLALAFDVLEKLDNYGYDACSDDIFVALHNAISHPQFVVASHSSTLQQPGATSLLGSKNEEPQLQLPRVVQDRFHYHLRQSMKLLVDGPLSHRVYAALLETYAGQQHWNAFWSVWRDMAQEMINRTPEMYVTAFRGTASGGHQSQAQRTLREILPQMDQEEPPVELKQDVAVAVAECLAVAKFDAREPFGVALKKRLELALNDDLLRRWNEESFDSTAAASAEEEELRS